MTWASRPWLFGFKKDIISNRDLPFYKISRDWKESFELVYAVTRIAEYQMQHTSKNLPKGDVLGLRATVPFRQDLEFWLTFNLDLNNAKGINSHNRRIHKINMKAEMLQWKKLSINYFTTFYNILQYSKKFQNILESRWFQNFP